MVKNIPKYLVFLGLLLIHFSSSGQAPDDNRFRFKRITVEDGLSNNIVYNVIMDENGILWFGLNHGIDKYDGYDFKHYDLSVSGKENIRGHRPVNAIFQLNDREFWIGAGPELYRYNVVRDTFVTILGNLKTKLGVNLINNLYITDDSMCYMGTNIGVIQYDMRKGEVKQIQDMPSTVTSFFYWNNILWVGTSSGLRFLDTETDTFKEIFLGNSKEIIDRITPLSYYYDKGRQLLIIGTRSSGLYLLNLATAEIEELKMEGKSFPRVRVIKKWFS